MREAIDARNADDRGCGRIACLDMQPIDQKKIDRFSPVVSSAHFLWFRRVAHM